jgi:hypothetical protein
VDEKRHGEAERHGEARGQGLLRCGIDDIIRAGDGILRSSRGGETTRHTLLFAFLDFMADVIPTTSGPEGTPFEGGVFVAELKFPKACLMFGPDGIHSSADAR